MKNKPEVSALRKKSPEKKPGQFTKVFEKISTFASVTTDAVKISTTASVVLGGPMMWMYLASAGAPFPAGDSGTALMLIIFMMMLTAGLLLIVTWILLPSISKLVASSAVQQHFSGLFQNPNGKEKSSRKFFRSYILLYYPLLGFYLISAFSIYASLDFSNIFPQFSVAITVSIVIEMVYLKISGRSNIFDIAMFKIISNAISAFWTFLFSIFLSEAYKASGTFLVNSGFSNFWKVFTLTTCALFIFLLTHILLSRWKPTLRSLAILAAACVSLLFFYFPGAVPITSTSLKNLGFGGGVPVTMMVKRSQPNDKDAKPELVSGCLVLQTGTTVMIKTEDKSPDNCLIRKNFLEPTVLTASYKGIIVFQRNDVTEIREFSRPSLPDRR